MTLDQKWTVEKFQDRRAYGKKGEQIVAIALRMNGRKEVSVVPPGRGYDGYDIVADGEKYEVKRDGRADNTGELFFEVRSYEGAGGLFHTQARWWAHLLKDQVLIMRTADIIFFLLDGGVFKNGVRYRTGWGFEGKSSGYTIRRELVDRFLKPVVLPVNLSSLQDKLPPVS